MQYSSKYPLLALAAVCIALCGMPALATVYTLDKTTNVIGTINYVQADFDDTLLDIGKTHGFGLEEMKLANPGVDTWLPGEGRNIVLPSEFILPNAPRVGIVLNIPEMRLYYFPATKRGKPPEVITYPLGIGREGWATPYMQTRIVKKSKNPSWYPPESIRKEHEEIGDPLPRVVPPGPDNPMGEYALRLAGGDYSIHGTNKAFGMGMRVSHGCIRLFPDDIKDLFNRVSINTPVNIINQPFKVGERDGVIYLEVHPHLDEDHEFFSRNNLAEVVVFIIESVDAGQYKIDWELVRKVVDESTGMPVAVGMKNPAPVGAAARISTGSDSADVSTAQAGDSDAGNAPPR